MNKLHIRGDWNLAKGKLEASMKTVLCVIALCLFGVSGFARAPEYPPRDTTIAEKNTCLSMCAHCKLLAAAAGKCPKCDMYLTSTRILAIKDGMAYGCACPVDCSHCLPTNDAMTKCACGKEIAKGSVKGMYVCGNAPKFTCNQVSDKPRKCECGKDMKQVE